MPEVAVPMDDSELMQAALAPEPNEAPQEQPQEPKVESGERQRDDKGRFVAKEPDQPQEVEQEPQQLIEPKDDQDGAIPSWRLKEVREARDKALLEAREADAERRALRDQVSQMQRQLEELNKPKADPVDFFQSPDEAFSQRISPLEQRLQSAESRLVLRASRAEAVAEFGKAAVSEAEAAVEKAMRANHPGMMALSAQVRASDHPVGVVMDWYKQNSLYERTGGDLDAYVQKQLDAKLKDPEFLAKAMEAARAQAGSNSSRPPVQIPPSLNKATGSGGNPSRVEPNDMSDAALFAYATAPGKR